MAFVVQTIVKKAPGSEWWSKSNAEAAKRLHTYASSLKLVLRKRNKLIDENTFGQRMWFADEAAHAQYMSALESNPDFQARETWAATKGETKTETSKVI